MIRRYESAYSVANGLVNSGDGVKYLGMLVMVLSVLLLALAVPAVGGERVVVLILGSGGIILGLNFYNMGVLRAASGQLLLATLDTAVNTSPFLSNDEKKSALGLGSARAGAEVTSLSSGEAETSSGKSAEEDALMTRYGIKFDGQSYHYGDYRYVRLEDAVNHARAVQE